MRSAAVPPHVSAVRVRTVFTLAVHFSIGLSSRRKSTSPFAWACCRLNVRRAKASLNRDRGPPVLAGSQFLKAFRFRLSRYMPNSVREAAKVENVPGSGVVRMPWTSNAGVGAPLWSTNPGVPTA